MARISELMEVAGVAEPLDEVLMAQLSWCLYCGGGGRGPHILVVTLIIILKIILVIMLSHSHISNILNQ